MAEQQDQPELWNGLSGLPDTCLVSPQWLARQLHRGEDAIRRAVARGELPPPLPLCSKRYWPVAYLREFLVRRARALEASPLPGEATDADTPRAPARTYSSALRKA